jgi:hypothetical protein
MRVRLTRKLADSIDGVNLADRRVDDVFDLPEIAARLLLAEGWAVSDSATHPVERHVPGNSRSVGGLGGEE